MTVYHVSAASSAPHPDGSESAPFRTIGMAASLAMPGDTVLVHDGVYRESVDPANGGIDDYARIVYAAAPGEHPVIKGSEPVSGWRRCDGTDVWSVTVPNSLFAGFNPFATPLKGDWLERPSDWTMSLGCVYLDGRAMFEAPSVEAVRKAERRTSAYGPDWVSAIEPMMHPEDTIWQWHAEVSDSDGTTTIWGNFHDIDPNEHLTEINVRETCFYPSQPGRDYITLHGFEIAQAACRWAPPTGDQRGMVGPHWSRGWIIEDNDLHDARCSAVSLGKDASTGDNEATRLGCKPGYQVQVETVFRALRRGWCKEDVGGHVVRRNHIHDCGQNGIVGNLGCAFSVIEDNHIHAIGSRQEFFGHEIAGIKLHAAIDTQIRRNRIHDCTLGTWLDWQMQGTRVSSNVYYGNRRDFMIEVTSGPALVDDNVFGSDYSLDNAAQGTAFVHNLFCGTAQPRPVLNRSMPYHLPHSTELAGFALHYGGDDRFYNNVFVGGPEFNAATRRGTAYANGSPTSEAEYMERVHRADPGDVEIFEAVPQPMYIDGNAYLRGSDGSTAPAFERERHGFSAPERKDGPTPVRPQAAVVEEPDGSVWLETDLEEGFFETGCVPVDTARLGTPRICHGRYENPDGTPLRLDHDLTGTRRGDRPVPGPLETLAPGHNRIRLD